MNGERIKEYDFSYLPPVNKMMEFIDRQPLAPNSYYTIVSDIYKSENKIFFMILSVNEEIKIEENKILQFEIEEQKLKPKTIIDLGKGWFGPIYIAVDCIVTSNHITTELTKYDLYKHKL